MQDASLVVPMRGRLYFESDCPQCTVLAPQIVTLFTTITPNNYSIKELHFTLHPPQQTRNVSTARTWSSFRGSLLKADMTTVKKTNNFNDNSRSTTTTRTRSESKSIIQHSALHSTITRTTRTRSESKSNIQHSALHSTRRSESKSIIQHSALHSTRRSESKSIITLCSSLNNKKNKK